MEVGQMTPDWLGVRVEAAVGTMIAPDPALVTIIGCPFRFPAALKYAIPRMPLPLLKPEILQ
jgi:hypothetical protein